jgi:hypothetical protein
MAPAPLAEYHDFFGGSVGAAAALIGLLFVAISIAPERTFGESADRRRRANAERAFTALVNVFFVSLAALLPHASLGAIAAIGALALIQASRLVLDALRTPAERAPWTQLGLLSVAIYVLELWFTVRLISGSDTEGLIWVVFGLYSYALSTSWGLLGSHTHHQKPR